MIIRIIILLSILSFILLTTRILMILPALRPRPRPRPHTNTSNSTTHLLIVLGSGGHTAEMLSILNGIDCRRYTFRTYIVNQDDPISEQAAIAFENTQDSHSKKTSFEKSKMECFTIRTIPRARRIHQPIWTAPWTCTITLYAAIRLLWSDKAPNIILINGPATSAIVVLASMILRFLDIGSMKGHETTRIIFVESLARIRGLSLTAKVIAWAVDRLIVQWKELEGLMGGKAEYGGLVAMQGL